MIEVLTGVGYSIIGFAFLIAIGLIMLYSLGRNVANCPTGYTYNANTTATFTDNNCCLNIGSNCNLAGNYTSPSTATQQTNNINGYLGTSNGGLASWIPLVIIMIVGMVFLGNFLINKRKNA
jgi:putative Mn2+ efflux pump MntP